MTAAQSDDHGRVAVAHDGQRQKEAHVLKHPVGQNPVARMHFIVVIEAGEGGCVGAGHGQKHHVWDGQSQTREPEWDAHPVHGARTPALHAGDRPDDGQVAVKADARQEEAATEDVEVFHQSHQLAEGLSEQPSAEGLGHGEGKRDEEHEIGHGEVEEEDVCDAQNLLPSQEDGYHQAVPRHPEHEDEAVQHRLDRGIKHPHVQLVGAAVPAGRDGGTAVNTVIIVGVIPTG